MAYPPPIAPENELKEPRPLLPVAMEGWVMALGVWRRGDGYVKGGIPFLRVKEVRPLATKAPVNDQFQRGYPSAGMANANVDVRRHLLGYPQALNHFDRRAVASQFAFPLLEARPFQGT